MDFHSLGRRTMNGRHKPFRLVGSDWNDPNLYRRAARANLTEECGVVARISGKINIAAAALEDETAPECSIPVEKSTPGKMLGRYRLDTDGGVQGHLIPPVKLGGPGYFFLLEE